MPFASTDLIEEVQVEVIETDPRTFREQVWDGCLSAYTQFGEIFHCWVEDVHYGEHLDSFRFLVYLHGPHSQPYELKQEDTCIALDLHSGTKIYVYRV
ncbi:hypothetical protein IAT38_005234 [Cryptococcus sp. DSM 104549]